MTDSGASPKPLSAKELYDLRSTIRTATGLAWSANEMRQMYATVAALQAQVDERKSLIVPGQFVAHSGGILDYKIECDALTDKDIGGIAGALALMLPEFGSVEGVPRGGLRLAKALTAFTTEGPLLIVDDVCTTGASLEAHRRGREAMGAVIFNRGSLPSWCRALFHTESVVDELTRTCNEQEKALGHARRRIETLRAQLVAASEQGAPNA